MLIIVAALDQQLRQNHHSLDHSKASALPDCCGLVVIVLYSQNLESSLAITRLILVKS